ncbi:hypothetical protein [Microbacterium sp. 2MCAF23]|uniref:hypothetical protein n=1 Tax=Microbacterium sp. 2MCAF23 TaxID=3232985 RepID=UPI003F993A9A
MGNQDAMGKLKPYYDALSGDTAKFYDIASKTGMSAAETRLALEAMTNGIGSQNEAIKRGVELKGQEKAANADVTDSTKSAGESYLDEAKKVDELNLNRPGLRSDCYSCPATAGRDDSWSA